jgi:hypothetical protein
MQYPAVPLAWIHGTESMPSGVVFKNCFLSLSDGSTSTDISVFLREASVTLGRDEVEDTAVGDDAHTFTDGLRNDAFRATVKMGYGAGSPEAVLSPLIDAGTVVSVEMRPNKDLAVGVANPRYRLAQAKILGPDFMPVGGRVGELIESPIVIRPVSGNKIFRTTT